jgi:tetratricopeptide (TPR) repeat protein
MAAGDEAAKSSALSALGDLVSRYKALLDALASKETGAENLACELLLVRDKIANIVREVPALSNDLTEKISKADDRLRKDADRILLRGGTPLEHLRDILQPPERNWWWWYREPPSTRYWTVGSVLFLTLSVTMITDFAHRILSADPDELGLASVAFGAVLAVGSTGTFTETGRQWIESIFSFLGMSKRYRPGIKFGLSVGFFLLLWLAWSRGPARMAIHYNNAAFQTPASDSARALQLYQRAINLNPQLPDARYNLGELYEYKYEYEKAATQYRETIIADPAYVKAYSNLSRVLILGNQPLAALRVANDALKLPSPDASTTAALLKNQAWAEYQLGFLAQAEAAAKLATRPPDPANTAYCILGKIYNKQGKTADERRAWEGFRATSQTSTGELPMIEPDCKLLAEAFLHETK